MNINFFRLHNINQRLYKRAIMKIFFSHCYYKDKSMRYNFHLWTVNVYPTNDIEDRSDYWDGLIDGDDKVDKNIPHGNTGLYVINLFIYDQNYSRYLEMNMRMASHEIAHAVLMLYYGVPNSDIFVGYVHKMNNENKIRSLKFWWFNRSLKFVRRIHLRILDVSKMTNTKFHNKGFSPY